MNTELQKRVITGLVGGLSLLAVLILGGWVGAFVLVSLLSLGLIQEYSVMAFSLPDQLEKRYLMLLLTWIVAFLNLVFSQNEYLLLILTFLGLFFYFLMTARRFEGLELTEHFKELTLSLFGLFYLAFLPLFFRKIYEVPVGGVGWAILFLLINWAGDTGAYFGGKKYGKIKLYPEMSPKKTREGAWVGLASSVGVSILFKLIYFRSVSVLSIIVIALIVGAVAQAGDLCESFLKRAFSKKDSGTLLPGHGGLLDRFDGVVFSLPVMYACIRVFT